MKGIWKYSHLLPVVSDDCKPSLGEGDTPLVRSRQIGRALGLANLYFKLEMLNPSGSYKDRFAACAVAELLQQGQQFCLATSSGNTGAALAAYCAASDIKCYLAIVDGAPEGKLRQMQVYGAETLMVKDFGIIPEISRDVFSGLEAMAATHGTIVQISAYHYSPFGMAGVQTIAYEIAESLPHEHCQIFSPAGGGGLTLAMARGFSLWKESNPAYQMPRVHCVQPEGNDTIASSLRKGLNTAVAVGRSTTTISGLQVPNVIDGDSVISACRLSDGTGWTVADELIYKCQADMALKEGIFCEPAGAVALAGVLKALEQGELNERDPVVCLVTGHGFKDPVAAAKVSNHKPGHRFDSIQETLQFIQNQIQSSR